MKKISRHKIMFSLVLTLSFFGTLLAGSYASQSSFSLGLNRDAAAQATPPPKAAPAAREETPKTPSATSSTSLPPPRTRNNTDLPSKRYSLSADLGEITFALGPLGKGATQNTSSRQVGLGRQVGVTASSRGRLFVNPDGSRVRLLAIKSPDAIALRLRFERFNLPAGDEVYVYGVAADSYVAGPYTRQGPFGEGKRGAGGSFWSDTIEGDTILVEHFIRGEERGFLISELSHLYARIPGNESAPNVLACHNDGMCFSDVERDAVGRILYTDSGSGSSFVCTGTMMNNRISDFAPYFYTANHCVSDQDTAQTVEAYWYYRTTACNSGVVSSAWVRTNAGARVLATQQTADSTLLRLFNPVPGLTYVGWDPNVKAVNTAVFNYSHPGGGLPPSTTSYLRRASGIISALTDDCSATGLVNGYTADWSSGLVEPGSSGSGLFYSQSGNFLVGVLSCGPVTPSCADFALYGKFSDFFPAIQTYMDLGDNTGACTPTAISAGQTVNGSLASTDCRARSRGASYFADRYSFNGTAGQQIAISMSSANFDTYLYLTSPTKTIAAQDDDGGAGVDSRIPADSGFFTLPASGTYVIEATSFSENNTGAYTLSLTVQVPCSYSISPTSASIGLGGGSGFVSVTAGSGCFWTAASNAAWITVTSGSSGTGSGTVNYSVAANTGAARSGTITIAGQTFTVNQGSGCTFSISPANQSFTASAGTGSVSVTAGSGCFWTATSNDAWITVTSGSSGTGSGTVNYSVAANTGAARSGTITIAGQTFTVNQAAPPCSYSINPTSANVVAGGGTGSVSVTAGTGCAWTAVSNAAWITVTSGSSGSGNGTVNYSVAANTGAARMGTVTIATQTFTVNQAAPSCTPISVSIPTNLTVSQGSVITVPINVGNLTGQGVVSYDFTLAFSSSVLSAAGPAFDASGTLSSGMTVTPNTSTPGQITISAFGISPLSGSGTLLNLRFNVVGAPNSTTGLNFSLFRFNEGTPCSTTTNGFFIVQPNFTISGVVSFCTTPTKKVTNVVLTTNGAPPLSGTSNSSGNYTISNIPGGAVTVTPAKTGDVNGISSFDASQVAQASAGLITLTSCQQVAADASNNGSVSSFDASQIAQFAAGLPVNPPNVTGTWKFVPANRLYNPLSSNLSNENYDAVLVGDVSGNWTSPTGPSGNTGTTVQIPVTLPNLSTKAGSSVTVPVKVGNFGTSRIVSYDFEIEFDPSVLQLLDSPVDVAGTLSDAFTITPNPAAGRLRVSGFGLARLEGSGTLLNLKFNVVGAPGASSALTWRGFAFNEDAQSNLTGGGVIIAPSNGLQYYPLARSVRLLDTRPGESGCFVPGAPLGDGMVLKQSAVGACSGIPANAVAVVGNATAVNFISTGSHWITFYPSNEQRPNTSNLNFRDNQVMSNWFTARLGADGAFNIYSHASTHLVIDVAGYYAPPEPKGLYYHPLPASVRLFDSRSGANACDAPGNPLANNGIRTVKAHGTCFNAAIPTSAQAIVGSATAINFLSSGFNWATLYASGDPVPKSSSLNFTANEVVSNWFTAKLSGDGKFNIYSRASTHFVIDVAGYFSNEPVDENGMGLLYHPLAKPVRLLDTRSGGQACNAPGIPLEGYGIASLTARGTCLGETIPDTAKAIEGSATAVNFLSTGFNWITLHPFGTPQPNLSSLNFTANQIVLNWFTVGLSNDGKVSVYSQAPTHLILDLTGYFAR
jgi:hypothetical protein